MIKFVEGDILQADVEALVNTVNCVGVMGRGIALQFKKRFPANFSAYASACKKGDVQPGQMFVYDTGTLTNPRLIINFPTKRHWRGKSRIEDIELGLNDLVKVIHERGIESIAIPSLGSGLGGLEWTDVRPLIVNRLEEIEDLDVRIFEPGSAPQPERMVRNRNIPNMTPGRAALVVLMDRYLEGLMDPFVTLIEVHKLLHFLQETGEPLNLSYKKGHYGPYAEKLRFVLNDIEGHLVSGYADGGDRPDKRLSLVPGAIADAQDYLRCRIETTKRIERVAELVEGFETPLGLELLGTVFWVTKYENAYSLDSVVDKVHQWNNHKRRFSKNQIATALDVLSKKGWIEQAA